MIHFSNALMTILDTLLASRREHFLHSYQRGDPVVKVGLSTLEEISPGLCTIRDITYTLSWNL
jgi:hypothetical protein